MKIKFRHYKTEENKTESLKEEKINMNKILESVLKDPKLRNHMRKIVKREMRKI